MRASMVGLLVVVAMAACKEDIARPPDESPVDAEAPLGPAGMTTPDAAPDPVDLPPAPTCGLDGLACCPGNSCDQGGCCVAGKCVAQGSMCSTIGSCVAGSCGGCGAIWMGTPQACCDQRTCTGSRTTCAGDGAGTCQACGGKAQRCCADGFCQSGLTCDRTKTPDPLCLPAP